MMFEQKIRDLEERKKFLEEQLRETEDLMEFFKKKIERE